MIEKYTGILLSYFETGFEAMCPSILLCTGGIYPIDPHDHLTIFDSNYKKLFDDIIEVVDSKDFFFQTSDLKAGWRQFDGNPYGQFYINDYWVDFLPSNIELKLWWDVFFSENCYEGRLIKLK